MTAGVSEGYLERARFRTAQGPFLGASIVLGLTRAPCAGATATHCHLGPSSTEAQCSAQQ